MGDAGGSSPVLIRFLFGGMIGIFSSLLLLMQVVPLGGMIVLFFGGMMALFLFAAQRKARKTLEKELSELNPGDKIILTSGFYATVYGVNDNFLYLDFRVPEFGYDYPTFDNTVKVRRNAVAVVTHKLHGWRCIVD